MGMTPKTIPSGKVKFTPKVSKVRVLEELPCASVSDIFIANWRGASSGA